MYTPQAFIKNQTLANRWLVIAMLCGVLCFQVFPLIGQPEPYFVRFSTADGLPSNNASCLVEDVEGFLWVGTRSGIARFDGQQFVPFRRLSPKTALPEENVTALMADRRGWLWVRFSKQLFQVSLATFEVLRMSENMTPLCADDAGNIYFQYPEGIAIFKEEQGDFQRFPLESPGKKPVLGPMCTGKNGLIWLSTNTGVFGFDTRQHTYRRLNGVGDAADILAMTSDEQGMLWWSRWSSLEGGVIHYDPYADRALQTFSAGENGIPNTDLNSILCDGDNVWMATNSRGLCRYAVQEKRFYHYEADTGTPGKLWNDQVARLLKDRFGNLWVSSPFFLFQCRARRTTSSLFQHSPNDPNSLIVSQCGSITALTDDRMAFGTMAGISIFNVKKRSFLNVRLPAYSEYNNQINALTKAGAGGLWAASWTGLYHLDAQSGRILEYFITNSNSTTPHPERVKRIEVGPIRRMCRDRTGTLWAVNFNNHIVRMDEQNPARIFVSVDTLVADTFALNDRAESFLDLDQRYFLLGTLDGLVRYDRFQSRYELCPATFPGLARPVKIESLARSRTGDILLIANGKPFRLTWGAAAAKALPVPAEVFQCQHILEDSLGNVWASTENGVVQINEAISFSLFYDCRNYLNDNVLLIRPSVIPDQDATGKLYFGGARGVSVLDPQDFKVRQTAPPPVKIIDLTINGQAAELDSVIHHTTTLRLPYYQNNLAFAFAALNSAVPQRNRFAYRLNGGAWTDLGNQNRVNFSRLAPGTYILQVKAANSDGIWNEEGTQLRITILPPWWRSWPAYTIYLLLLGLALRRYLQFRENRLQITHQLEEERKEAERLQALDDFKSRFFTNISHEFRTPLTVILGMTERMTTAGKRLPENEAANNLGMITRSGQNLLRLINQILDLAKLESGKLTLQLEQADMVVFSRYILESLHSLSEIKDVSLHFETETSDLWMDIDLEKMQSILFNLLSNALKFTPEGGHIYLKVNRTEQDGQLMCSITVRDTGIGIPPEKIGRIFDRFYRVDDSSTRQTEGTGIGLALARELARLMHGDISVQSQPGEGAAFEVTLPVRTAAPKAEHLSEHLSTLLPSTGLMEVVPTRPSLPDDGRDIARSELPWLLLVEDNDDVRQFLRACVSEHYRVLEARNGQEGIEMALEHTPDLIVSDVMMPEKDGFELCQTLKQDERTSHIPIVLLTAKASVESRIAGLSRGADAYLSKPFHREELLLTIANLLHARRVVQERLRALFLTAEAAPAAEAQAATIAPEALAVLEIEDVFVQKIRGYVEDNLGNADLTMDELSRAMTMSYQNLHRKLSALTNLSPVQFIRAIRLQKAMSLLQTTRLPIGDIAFEVGFSDPKYFSRVFTEEFGKPPSAVR